MFKKIFSLLLVGAIVFSVSGMSVPAAEESYELYDPEHRITLTTTDPRAADAYLEVSVAEAGEEFDSYVKDLDPALRILLYTVKVKIPGMEEPIQLENARYRISYPAGTMPGRRCTAYEVTEEGTLNTLDGHVDYMYLAGNVFTFQYTGDKFIVTGVKKCGDLTADGELAADDALTALKMVVKLIPCSEAQKLIGDVNDDGKLDAVDAKHILYKVVGLYEYFSVEVV